MTDQTSQEDAKDPRLNLHTDSAISDTLNCAIQDEDLPSETLDKTTPQAAAHLQREDERYVNQAKRATHTMPTPGELLSAARERADLAIEEAATHLKLSSTYLANIEKNQFQLEKGALVYLKGHMRSYAKYLSIDPDYVARCFDAHHTDFATAAQHTAPATTTSTQGRLLTLARSLPMPPPQKMLASAGLFLLCMGIYATWHSHHGPARFAQQTNGTNPVTDKQLAQQSDHQHFELIHKQES